MSENRDTASYLEMAERLGRFLAAGTRGSLESIHIYYRGRIALDETALISGAAIVGVLAESGSGENAHPIDRMNAASVAAERGVRVQEEKKDATSGGTGSVLKLVLHATGGSTAGSATVLHESSPRLLSYDGINIEVPLTGSLVVIRNHDVPGVVGRIGTILGEKGLNIANFALGRAAASAAAAPRVPRGQALAVVQIDATDGAAVASAIEDLRRVGAIAEARLVELDK